LGEEDFRSEASLGTLAQKIIDALGRIVVGYTIEMDPEHGMYKVSFEVIRNGNHRITVLGSDLCRMPKFVELKSLIRSIRNIGPPPYRLEIGGEGDKMVELSDVSLLVEYTMNEGRKGITIQRYKGLGEMNPEQLWETTMNPDKRTLLQVRIEDAVKADEILSTLMGDQVEPRREFIYQNALQVSNLDI